MTRYVPTATAGVVGSRRFGYYTAGAAAAPAFTPLSLSPALWIDPSDASSVTISGSSGAYIGPNGLVLPGLSTDCATTADASALDITGDLDMIVKCAATDWTPSATQILLGKSSGSTERYLFSLTAAGNLQLLVRDVSTNRTFTSTVATGVTNAATKWVRAFLDVNNGGGGADCYFYLSDDGSSWAQLGTTVNYAGTITVSSGDGSLAVGRYGDFASNGFAGTIARAQVWSGNSTASGTKVFDADFESATDYVSAFTESALGAPVYVVSSTAASSTANYGYIGPVGLVGALSTGADGEAALPANVAYDTEDFEFVARVSLIDWTPGDYRTVYTHGSSGFDSGQRIGVRVNNRAILLDWWDGATFKNIASTSAMPDPGGGVFVWIKVTLDYNAGGTYAANFYYAADQSTEPSSWTQIGTQVTGAQASGTRPTSKPVYFRTLAGYTARNWHGVIKRVIVRNSIGGTIIIDADFVAAADYAAKFTESSSNAATVTITATNTPSAAAGALVSQINDLSGNARHLSQATAANMPKYWNGQSGYNVLVFDGTSDKIGPASAFTLAQPLSHAVVLATTDTGATARHLLANVSNPQPTTYQTSSKWSLYAGTALSTAASIDLATHVLVSTFNGGSSTIRLDGVVGATGAGGSSGYGGAQVAQLSDNVSFWKGISGEVVIAVISTPADIEAYLKAKWGTP